MARVTVLFSGKRHPRYWDILFTVGPESISYELTDAVEN